MRTCCPAAHICEHPSLQHGSLSSHSTWCTLPHSALLTLAEAVALLDCGTQVYQWLGRSIAERSSSSEASGPAPGPLKRSAAEQLLTLEVERLVAARPLPVPEVSCSVHLGWLCVAGACVAELLSCRMLLCRVTVQRLRRRLGVVCGKLSPDALHAHACCEDLACCAGAACSAGHGCCSSHGPAPGPDYCGNQTPGACKWGVCVCITSSRCICGVGSVERSATELG